MVILADESQKVWFESIEKVGVEVNLLAAVSDSVRYFCLWYPLSIRLERNIVLTA